MDAQQLKTEIKDRYRAEYTTAAINKMPGLLGRFARWEKKPETRGSRAAGAGIALALMAGGAALVPVVGLVTAFVLFVGVATGGTVASFIPLALISSRATRAAKKTADATMDRDIASRTLVTRYKNEVVDHSLELLEGVVAGTKAKSQQLAELALHPEFNKAATATPPAQPAQKHRLNLKHLLKRSI